MSHETALDWFNRKRLKKSDHLEHLRFHDNLSFYSIWENATAAFLSRETNASLLQRSLSKQLNENNVENGVTNNAGRQQQHESQFFFQEGTNIRFVDEILKDATDVVNVGDNSTSGIQGYSHELEFPSHADNGEEERESKNVVFEISGATCTGKTALVTTLAASFVASTSKFVYQSKSPSSGCNESNSRIPAAPQVIILDSAYGIHACHLASAVRTSVLRMWEKKQKHRNSNFDTQQYNHDMEGQNRQTPALPYSSDANHKDATDIENEILSGLSRIHITRPEDLGIGFVSSLEAIKYALDDMSREQMKVRSYAQQGDESVTFGVPVLESLSSSQQKTSKIPAPPIMIIIDSLNAFEYRDQMLEGISDGIQMNQNNTVSSKNSPNFKTGELNTGRMTPSKRRNGSGLSGRNDFLRQFQRLLGTQNSNIIVVATKSVSSKSFNKHNRNMNDHYNAKAMDPWDKLVTHKVTLERAIKGTEEQKQGFEFVAIFRKRKNNGKSRNFVKTDSNMSYRDDDTMGPLQIIPYSVTCNGITC